MSMLLYLPVLTLGKSYLSGCSYCMTSPLTDWFIEGGRCKTSKLGVTSSRRLDGIIESFCASKYAWIVKMVAVLLV